VPFTWIGEGSLGKNKGEHVPIFVNTDKYEVKDSGTFWLSNEHHQRGSKVADSVAARICTWCKLIDKEKEKEKDESAEFVVCNTHWDQGREARLFSATKMRDMIENETDIGNIVCVALGDYNCTKESDDLKLFCTGTDNIKNLITPKEERKDDQSEDEENPFQLVIGEVICAEDKRTVKEESFVGTKKGKTIDFILVSPDIVVKTYTVLSDSLASTHRPIIADLIIV